LGDLDRRLERWSVLHRTEPLDSFFVFLSYIGSFGAIWLAIAAVVAFSYRRPTALPLTFIAVLLGDTSSEGVSFGVGDQVAMVLLGLFIAAGIMLLARPSLVADERGLHVRNIFVSHDVPWEVVREVAFRDGSPWATLELADDDQLALLAVQASDGERAVATVRALRALQARHAGAGEGPPPDGHSHGVI